MPQSWPPPGRRAFANNLVFMYLQSVNQTINSHPFHSESFGGRLWLMQVRPRVDSFSTIVDSISAVIDVLLRGRTVGGFHRIKVSRCGEIRFESRQRGCRGPRRISPRRRAAVNQEIHGGAGVNSSEFPPHVQGFTINFVFLYLRLAHDLGNGHLLHSRSSGGRP